MARQRNQIHTDLVEEWKKKNDALSPAELTQLLIKAIHGIRERTLVSLSNVTVTAVIDRTLSESKDRFPPLRSISNTSEGINFGKFIDQIQTFHSDEVNAALQDLLIELLDVFGKITAEILTKYLHQELMAIAQDQPESITQLHSTSSAAFTKKNRDRK